jgi:hypothetical protein
MAFNRRNPIWPYLLVLACLFALSIAAPRGWQRGRQPDASLEQVPAQSIGAAPSLSAEVVHPATIVDSHSSGESAFDSPMLDTKPQLEASADRIAERWRLPAPADTTGTADSPVLSGPFWPADENWLASTANSSHVDSVSLPTTTSAAPLMTAEPADNLTPSASAEPAPVLAPVKSAAPEPRIAAEPSQTSDPKPESPPSSASSAPTGQADQQATPEPSPLVPAPEPAWPRPVDLYSRLDRLARIETCRQWTDEVKMQFGELAQLGPRDCNQAQGIFAQLRRLLGEGESLVTRLTDASVVSELHRTQYAIVRRIDVWEQICTIRRRTASTSIAEGTERMLDLIERYETDRRTSDAHHLADIRRQILASPEPDEQELARRLGVHYRNANLRIAVTSTLVDRMIPPQQPSNGAVNETILGNPVRGTSTISTQLSVRLIPDDQNWRFDFVAEGTVESRTRTTHGSFTFANAGQATYQIHKRIVVTPDAVKVYSAAGDANNTTELQGLCTSFDSVPFIGSLIRNYAVSKEQEQQGQANWEAEQKVATKAIGRMNSEVNPRLAEAQQNFQRNWLEPMRKLALDPTAIEMRTTDSRLLLRSRLAGNDQLGAHTPRPEALSSSLLSTQIHESTLNNLLDHLDLAGRTFTLVDLRRWLSDKLGREPGDGAEDLPEGVRVTFARQDPIRIRCDANRLELILSIAEIRDARRRWHDFEVRAAYRPVVHGLVAQFERDGTIELGGQYKGKPEVALRGIFSKVLSRERKLNLLPDSFVNDKRLAGLEVMQLVIEDGWIGTAIGPVRTAGRPATTTK